MYEFEHARPTTIADAVTALGREEATALSGGQTLVPTLKMRLAAPSVLVSLAGIAEMKGVRHEGGTLTIGGGTPHGVVAAEAKKVFPGLAGLASKIGDPSVRKRGTIGGSLANNDPSACYPSAALACGATIVTDRREIAAEEFFVGMFTTALEEGEIVTSVRFPVPDASNYQKFEQPASRFPLVGVFVARFVEEARVGVTGASEGGVFRWIEAEAALQDRFEADALKDMAPLADGMISDLHGNAAYRAHITGVMTRRAVAAAG